MKIIIASLCSDYTVIKTNLCNTSQNSLTCYSVSFDLLPCNIQQNQGSERLSDLSKFTL